MPPKKLYESTIRSLGLSEADIKMMDKYLSINKIENKSTYAVFQSGVNYQVDLLDAWFEDKTLLTNEFADLGNRTEHVQTRSRTQAEESRTPLFYRYVLGIIDVQSNVVDAEPITLKETTNAIEAMKKILARKIIKPRTSAIIFSDGGGEFNSIAFKEYLRTQKINLHITLRGNKNQNAKIEHFNGFLRKTVFRKNQLQNIKTVLERLAVNPSNTDGEVLRLNTSWANDIKTAVATYNDVIQHNREHSDRTQKIGDFFKDNIISKKENFLSIGDKVIRMIHDKTHVIDPKEESKKVQFEKKATGHFRANTIRFSIQEFIVSNIIFRPNQPVRYMLEGIKNVSYLRDQLKKV
jgi:hypothetical protein